MRAMIVKESLVPVWPLPQKFKYNYLNRKIYIQRKAQNQFADLEARQFMEISDVESQRTHLAETFYAVLTFVLLHSSMSHCMPL